MKAKDLILKSLPPDELAFLIQRHNQAERERQKDLARDDLRLGAGGMLNVPDDTVETLNDVVEHWSKLDKGWALLVDDLIYPASTLLPRQIITPTGLVSNRIQAEFALRGKLHGHSWLPIAVSDEEDAKGYLFDWTRH
jgi:hypothetical protein